MRYFITFLSDLSNRIHRKIRECFVPYLRQLNVIQSFSWPSSFPHFILFSWNLCLLQYFFLLSSIPYFWKRHIKGKEKRMKRTIIIESKKAIVCVSSIFSWTQPVVVAVKSQQFSTMKRGGKRHKLNLFLPSADVRQCAKEYKTKYNTKSHHASSSFNFYTCIAIRSVLCVVTCVIST